MRIGLLWLVVSGLLVWLGSIFAEASGETVCYGRRTQQNNCSLLIRKLSPSDLPAAKPSPPSDPSSYALSVDQHTDKVRSLLIQSPLKRSADDQAFSTGIFSGYF